VEVESGSWLAIGPVGGWNWGESAPMDEGRISMPYRYGKKLHDDTIPAVHIPSTFLGHVVSPLLTYFFPNFPLGHTGEEKGVRRRGKR